MNPRRYPVAPLRKGRTTTRLAVDIGVCRRTICRWQRHGMTEAQADRAACALGTHPRLVWDDWAT